MTVVVEIAIKMSLFAEAKSSTVSLIKSSSGKCGEDSSNFRTSMTGLSTSCECSNLEDI